MTAIEIALFVALLLFLVLHLFAAAFTTWHLSKSTLFEPSQKMAHYAIVWLIPIVGVAIVLHILSPDLSPNILRRRPGWIPWCEFLLVSAFVSRVNVSIENASQADIIGSQTALPDGDAEPE